MQNEKNILKSLSEIRKGLDDIKIGLKFVIECILNNNESEEDDSEEYPDFQTAFQLEQNEFLTEELNQYRTYLK